MLKDLAPTGKLRAAINFGNVVLAQRRARPASRAASRRISRASSAKRLGVPVELVTFDAAGKVFEAAKAGAWDIAVSGDRAGARRRDRLHARPM